MPLISIVVHLAILGVVMYLINKYIPMSAGIKDLINVVVVIAAVFWVLQVTGLWAAVNSWRLSIPH